MEKPSETSLRCLIATGNPHKSDAIRRILTGYPFELIDLSDLDPIREPEETGLTFLENALLKSRYYCQESGMIALADDSGLEVDALGGQPGIYSSRFAGEDSPHSVKMAKILELLSNTPEKERTARFRCVAAISFPDGREFHAQGAMEGLISDRASGSGGFGYDPIVYLPSLRKSVAALTDSEKDEISHRGNAFRKLADSLNF